MLVCLFKLLPAARALLLACRFEKTGVSRLSIIVNILLIWNLRACGLCAAAYSEGTRRTVLEHGYHGDLARQLGLAKAAGKQVGRNCPVLLAHFHSGVAFTGFYYTGLGLQRGRNAAE